MTATTTPTPLNTQNTNLPEMPIISPTVSHSSDDLHPSDNSNTTAEDDLTTPPDTPPAASGSSAAWITVNPETGLRNYNFPSLNKKAKAKPSPFAHPKLDKNKPTEVEWSAHARHMGSLAYNNDQADQADQDTALFSSSIPRMDFSLSMISPSPTPEPTNAYVAATSPYTKPGATLAVVGMRREKARPVSPASSFSSSKATYGSSVSSFSSSKATAGSPHSSMSSTLSTSSSTERPHVSMPKSQPLARALFTKLTENTPASGRKLAKGQKLIVPGKEFKTSFELPLTSSEFARRF